MNAQRDGERPDLTAWRAAETNSAEAHGQHPDRGKRRGDIDRRRDQDERRERG